MIHIGGTKLIFRKDIIAIFQYNCVPTNVFNSKNYSIEYICPPPYKACILANINGIQTVFFTSLSARTLNTRLLKGTLTEKF